MPQQQQTAYIHDRGLAASRVTAAMRAHGSGAAASGYAAAMELHSACKCGGVEQEDGVPYKLESYDFAPLTVFAQQLKKQAQCREV